MVLMALWFLIVSVPWAVKDPNTRHKFQKSYLFNLLTLLLRQVFFFPLLFIALTTFRCLPKYPLFPTLTCNFSTLFFHSTHMLPTNHSARHRISARNCYSWTWLGLTVSLWLLVLNSIFGNCAFDVSNVSLQYINQCKNVDSDYHRYSILFCYSASCIPKIH